MGKIIDRDQYLALVSYRWTFARRRNCPRAQPVSVFGDKDMLRYSAHSVTVLLKQRAKERLAHVSLAESTSSTRMTANSLYRDLSHLRCITVPLRSAGDISLAT